MNTNELIFIVTLGRYIAVDGQGNFKLAAARAFIAITDDKGKESCELMFNRRS